MRFLFERVGFDRSTTRFSSLDLRIRLAQELRGKKGEPRARQVVETSLILLEGRAATSEKELDVLLEQLQEVKQGWVLRAPASLDSIPRQASISSGGATMQSTSINYHVGRSERKNWLIVLPRTPCLPGNSTTGTPEKAAVPRNNPHFHIPTRMG